MGPHIPGRARRVGEARVGLQPLLRLRRDTAEDDVQSPEAHVDRLADRDARQASTEVALYSPPRLHLAVAEPEPPVVGRAARDRSIALKISNNYLQPALSGFDPLSCNFNGNFR